MKNYLSGALLTSSIFSLGLTAHADGDMMINTEVNGEVEITEMNSDLTNEITASAMFMAEMDVIVDAGESIETYKTDDDITRREMLKVMMNLSGKTVIDTCNNDFADLDSDDWGCKYAEAALNSGYIAENTFFRPDDSVSEAEALKMVMQARGIERVANDDWRAGYESVALANGIIETELNYDMNAKRGLIFLSAARTYEEFTDEKIDMLLDMDGTMNSGIDTDGMMSSDDEMSATMNIVELAVGNENLSTLVAAVTKAELVETLSDENANFTVFAPTNQAFENLPEGVLESLLMDENMQDLVDILTYHVVSGEYISTDITDDFMLKTVFGEDISFEFDENMNVMINGNTKLEIVNVQATNGIIHIIDSVLMPSDM